MTKPNQAPAGVSARNPRKEDPERLARLRWAEESRVVGHETSMSTGISAVKPLGSASKR